MHLVLRFCLILILVAQVLASAAQQDSRLADQYYLAGEYEKAAELYEVLYRNTNRSDFYFNKYIECLLALEEYTQSVKIIEGQIALNPANVALYVTLGNVLERQNDYDAAALAFRKAIEQLPPDVGQISKLGNAFLGLTKYDEAIETFEKGQILINRPGLFAENLADLYRRKGDNEKMIENYLFSLQSNPQRLPVIQSTLHRFLGKTDYIILQTQLYDLLQEYPDADYFAEMLAWVSIQQKDFKAALRQLRALDQRLGENGNRVFRLAQMAANAQDFDVAVEAYEYIVAQKGPSSPFYLKAKESSLDCQRRRLVKNYDYTQQGLRDLEAQYEAFLNDIGRNRTTASIILDQARLEAFFINDLDKAIALLEEVITFPGVPKDIHAMVKLDLADFQLMKGEIWEATLLYSQVDKALKEEPLGEEARFRNARLAYFNGDFEWAQAQFDILKASTSKLISNDAIDMSVFIMDNLGLDTTAHPLTMYAEAELLVFQNRFTEARENLMILSNLYPDHGLQDDILYLQAQILMKQRRYEDAARMFDEIVSKYPLEIRADNALFALAELYDQHLGDPEKAKELYERIFIEYSGSTFSVEARKRFRFLRGDFSDL
jgi:tetratricopeptide (TPR) repeat protein